MILLFCAGQILADEVRIAVASNFTETIRSIAGEFQEETGHRVILSNGSSGKHYAQIKNGAPFDAFFSADSYRPELLEQQGVAIPGSRFTYAVGKLVLWSPQPGLVEAGGKVLDEGTFRNLSVANPKLAPYGKAAREVLQKRGLWKKLSRRMVRGENIGQAYQFVKSGNAELGFVALSQIQRPKMPISGSYWLIHQSLYTPINQQAVLLKDRAAARAFLDFVKRESVAAIIHDFGYGTADVK